MPQAYGSRGYGEIPPDATLQIDLELLSIKTNPLGGLGLPLRVCVCAMHAFCTSCAPERLLLLLLLLLHVKRGASGAGDARWHNERTHT